MSSAAFDIHRDERLPPLSWLFRLGQDGAWLSCGSGVETMPNAFFEGTWAAPFPATDFYECANVFGSGGRLTPAGWVLVPPAHTLEAIYVLQTPIGDWFASNSLAFLLTATGAEIEFRWPTLVAFLESVNGIEGSPRRLRTTNGVLHILHHHNAVLAAHLEVRPKPSPAPFAVFEDYRDYLRSVVEAAAKNASHPARRTRYRLVTSISSGYDSPACAALARWAGCSEGVTICQSRRGKSDDGSEIGRRLGLQVSRVQHPLFAAPLSEDPVVAAEFFATGMQGEDIWYSALDCLHECLFVTGFAGGRVWSRDEKASTVLKRGDLSGSGLGEFRLRRNFFHFPLPFVGALQHPSIYAISNGRAMEPWSIGGWYDRPIPRRIVEEAGVPRGLFGHHKRAISTPGYRLIPREMRGAIEELIRAQSLNDKIRYAVRLVWFNVTMAAHNRKFRGERWLLPALRPAYRRVWLAMLRRLMRYPFPIFEMMHPFGLFATAWSLSVVRQRYRGPVADAIDPASKSVCSN